MGRKKQAMTIPEHLTANKVVERIKSWDCLGCALISDHCRYHQALQEADYWRNRYEQLLATDIGELTADRNYWEQEAIRLTNELNGVI